MYHQNNVDYVKLLWEYFIYQIDNKAYKKQEKMYYPQFTKVIIYYFLTQDKTLSWRNKIRMCTSRDDYLINILRFVSTKEETQIYDAILPECLTNPEMKETQAYHTYLGKVDVTRGKEIELLSQLALTEDAQFKEVRKKIMRDFHKTHPSGSGTITKTAPSVAKIKPSATSEGTGVQPGVPDVAEEESSKSEAESWGNDEDDSNNEKVSSDEDNDQEKDSDDDKTQSDNELESDSKHETDESKSGSESDHDESEENEEDNDDEDEKKIIDKAEGDEDEEMDYATSQLYDDVDIRVNEPVDTDEGFVQEEGNDAAMTNTEVLVTSSSHLSDLAPKFLNFLDIPHTDYEIVSPLDVYVHHEVPSQQTPTLLTEPVLVISVSLQVFSTVIPQSLPSFTHMLQQSSHTPPPTTEATNPQYVLPNFAFVFQFNNRVSALQKEILPKEASDFAPPVIQSMVTKGAEKKDKDEDLSVRSNRGLKKRNTRKDAEPAKGLKAKESQSSSSKGDKSKSKSFGKSVQSEEPEFEVANSDMPHDQEENLDNDDEPKEKVASKCD
nr:hypothetical protein [Tanacetum cinerariifolium]